MRKFMIIQELITIKVLSLDTSCFEPLRAKFEEQMDKHGIGNKMRLGPKECKIAECFAIVRSYLEHYCVVGAPYHGKPFTVQSLLTMPLICVTEDVVKACTMCAQMYIPNDMSTVVSAIRVIATQKISTSAGEVQYRNPHAPAAQPPQHRFISSGQSHARFGGQAEQAGIMPAGGFVKPQEPPVNVEPVPVNYICLSGVRQSEIFAQITASTRENVSQPSTLSVSSCLSSLTELIIKAPTRYWIPGGEKSEPWENEEDTQETSMAALVFTDKSTYVHLSLLDKDQMSFENIWQKAVENMTNKHTVPRRMLSCVTVAEHPFLMSPVILGGNDRGSTVDINPLFVPQEVALALTGTKDQHAFSSVATTPLIENNIDTDIFYLSQNYIRNTLNANPRDALEFAVMNHPATKIARTKILLDQRDGKDANRFCSYPETRIELMEKLRTALINSKRQRNPGVSAIKSTDILAMQCGQKTEEERREFTKSVESAISRMQIMAATINDNESDATTVKEMAEMLGVEYPEFGTPPSMTEIIDAAMKKFNKTFYSETILRSREELVEEAYRAEEESRKRAGENIEEDEAARKRFDQDDDDDDNDDDAEKGEEEEEQKEKPINIQPTRIEEPEVDPTTTRNSTFRRRF
jgi:hypothetical protein